MFSGIMLSELSYAAMLFVMLFNVSYDAKFTNVTAA
jgi:hypothetical protein